MSLTIIAFIINTLGIKTSTLLSDSDDGIDARVRVQKIAYFLRRLGYNIGFDNGQTLPFMVGLLRYVG